MFSTALGIIGAIGVAAGSGLITYGALALNDQQKQKVYNSLSSSENKLRTWSNSNSNAEFNAYLRDSMNMGYIDGNTYKNSLNAYNKLRNNNYKFSSLNKTEAQSLTQLYNSLYKNDANFKSQWDKEYSKMTDEEKIDWLFGGGAGTSGGVAIPAPAYLDTSFSRYQKKVAPLKFYSNKELANLYDLDYNFDNIKKDYDAAAQANVDYTSWLSDLLANNGERNNVYGQTSYLDAIRNIKNQAVQKGMSNGAKAAAEVLANNEAVQNKVTANTDVATQRFEAMNDALKDRAQTSIKAYDMFDDLAQALSSAGVSLYANDVNRRGQDLLTNANILSADENLRSNRMAQNNLMASIYNSALAQSRAASAAANSALSEAERYFRDISLPANGNNFQKALSDYIGLAYTQSTGFRDNLEKWGSVVSK